MSTPPARRSEKTFTGWHMFAVITGFFTVVIAVNVTMAMFATGSWTGLVVKNSYVASQNYNAVLQDARAQDARGWTSALDYADGRLRLTLMDRSGAPISSARINVQLSRPVGIGEDRSVALVERLPGAYEALEQLGPGIWNIEVQARDREATPYRQIFRLQVREDG